MLKSKPMFLAAVFLVVLTGAVYSSVFNYPFINYDDADYIINNDMIHQQISWRSLSWAMTAMGTGDWHPLVWISFIVDKQLFGMNAGAFHGVNVILHILNVLLVLFIFKRATGSFWGAFFLAAFFALHPLRVESVAWVAERKDVLSGLFLWLTLGAYLKERRGGGSKYHYLAILFFILAVMAKPVVVTVPVLMPLFDFWPLQRISSVKIFFARVFEKTPFILLSLFSCIMAINANSGIRGIYSLSASPMDLRLANAVISVWTYIYQTLWPMALSLFYPFPHSSALSPALVVLATVAFFFVSFWAWRFRKQAPFVLAGWLWYVITLLPVIGLVRVSDQAMADRYMYVPHIGLGIMVIWGLLELPVKIRRPVSIGGVVLVFCMAGLSYRQTQYWQSAEMLNLHALKVTKNNHVAYGNLGVIAVKNKQPEKAKEYFLKVLEIRPGNSFALSSLGAILIQQEKYPEAEKHFKELARHYPRRPRIQYYLGVSYLAQKKYPEAEKSFFRAIQLKGKFWMARKALAMLYLDTRELEKARELIERLYFFLPKDATVNYLMGQLKQLSGDEEAASVFFDQAVEAAVSNPQELNRLILRWIRKGRLDVAVRSSISDPQRFNLMILEWLRDGKTKEAEAILRKVIEGRPDFFQAYINLANIEVMKKDYPEAAKVLAKALEINPDSAVAARLLRKAKAAIEENADRAPEAAGNADFFGTGLEISSPQDLTAFIDILSQRTGQN